MDDSCTRGRMNEASSLRQDRRYLEALIRFAQLAARRLNRKLVSRHSSAGLNNDTSKVRPSAHTKCDPDNHLRHFSASHNW